MKKIILLVLTLILIICSNTQTQIFRINEGFESYDSLTLPPGWSKWNMAPFPVDPLYNWTVRDTGVNLPGVADPNRMRAHSGKKAIGVSWYSGIDTNTAVDTIADAWLVTKRCGIISVNDYLTFWVCGGTLNFVDSLQLWISTVDSLPQHFTDHIITFHFPIGPWGNFINDIEFLDAYAGHTIWIGFRYYMDCSHDGVFVHLDDVLEEDPIGVRRTGTNVPSVFDMSQNFPNPFNPTTTIKFQIPKESLVNIKVYNILGQEVQTLLNEVKPAGYYTMNWDGMRFPSGTYFYRITAGDFVKTFKMVLVK